MGSIWESISCQTKIVFVWNKLFCSEYIFHNGELILWSLYGGHSRQCRNQQIKGKNRYFVVVGHNGNTSNAEALIDEVNTKKWKYTRILKIALDSILNCLTSYKCIMIQWDSQINTHERFGCNVRRQNICNVWRARGDGHHYEVTSKCCGATITTIKFSWVDPDFLGDEFRLLLFWRTVRLLKIWKKLQL